MINKANNYGKFILLWAGELISQIGGGLSIFGLGVYVFKQTGRASDMALITLFGFLPSLLLSAPAGVLADKYDRRLLMMIGDGCSGAGVVFILFCMINGGATLIQICIGVFISFRFSSGTVLQSHNYGFADERGVFKSERAGIPGGKRKISLFPYHRRLSS